MNPPRLFAIAATATLALLARTPPAQACGGFFCDRPPPGDAPPIAQAAENVLFVMDRDAQSGQTRVEAHIQIVYTGTAAQFSWVVPVTAPPTVDVGHDVLFDRLEPQTRPSFRINWQMDGTCKGFGGGGGDSSGCIAGGSSAGAKNATVAGGGGVDDGPAVEVVFRGNVGPYESVVLRSDNPTALKEWLATNGYFVSDAAAKIVDDYVAAKSYFVALKLQSGKDVSAIQPIVLRMTANEACLPLKLTAIAATPDLRINVWVLADGRAVPINYSEVGVNLARLDWFKAGANYDQLLGQAADEAGGNAFAVEYAQPATAMAAAFTVNPDQVQALAASPDPASYLGTLRRMGFPPTGEVLAVFRRYVPLPAALGITEAEFYKNLYNYWYSERDAFAPFDPVALTADLQATVFTPLTDLRGLFETHHTLTRLATFISAEEMTKDPLFVTNPALPDVSPQHLALAHMLCGDQDYDVCHAPVRLHLEDGSDVVFGVAAGAPETCNPSMVPNYDRGELDALPASDLAWRRDSDGPGDMVLDNRAAIAAAVGKHNATVATTPGGTCGCSVRGRSRPAAGVLFAAAAAVILWRRRRRGYIRA